MISPKEATDRIAAYIAETGGALKDWYVGIASNPTECLFARHCVDEKADEWIYATLKTDTEARHVEEALLQLGCDGGGSGEDARTIYVYAFRMTATTKR